MGFYCLLIEDEVMMPGLFLSIALQATPIVAPTTATPRTERRRSFAEYAGHMTVGKGFVERITQPTIAIDADIAMVWAPFTIFANGKVTSCGFDHFDLIREGGVWKVANLTFSTSTNC